MCVHRRLALMLAALALLAAASAARAGKLRLRYNLDRRVIRACNLLVPGGYTNLNPYLFIALQHSPLKPAGWEFDNPLASPYVTQRMFNYWQNAGHAPDAGSGPTYWTDRGITAPGAPINKSWPQYWEVYFNGYTAQRLRDFDLIYIAAADINLGPQIVSSLRRALIEAVEEGATLWIDSGGGYVTTVTNLEPPRVTGGPPFVPFAFVDPGAGTYWRQVTDPNSDLFRTPLALTRLDTYLLGDVSLPGWLSDGQYIDFSAASGPLDQTFSVVLSNTDGTNTNPAIAVCRYGAGRIVVTAIGVGQDVEEWLTQPGVTSPDAYQAPDVKLAYNIVAWGTSWESARQASNNIGYTAASVLPPLDIVWQYPSPDADPSAISIGPVVAAPVVSRGRVYAVSLIGENGEPARLLCFDAEPERDVDGDGVKDDGVPDYSLGRAYDLIWSVDLSALTGIADATPRWAGPTACALPDGTPAILCAAVSQTGSTPNGFVFAVNADTGAPIWLFAATPFDILDNANAEVRDISTPVVHRDWVYFLCSEFDTDLDGAPAPSADDTYGRAWCIDLQTGGNLAAGGAVWCFPDPDLDDTGAVDPTDTERPGLLPPFAEPLWVAGISPQDPNAAGRPRQLPPDPGMVPVVTTHTRNAEDYRTEAVMTVGTPVSMRWDPAASVIKINREHLGSPFDASGATNVRRGGQDIALVPTPGRNVGGVMQYFLNARYYRVGVRSPVTSIEEISRRDDPANITITGDFYVDPDSNQVIVVEPHAARYLTSAVSAAGIGNPLRPPRGLMVLVDYNGTITDELHWLRGAIPWMTWYSSQERRVTAPAVRNRVLFASTTVPDELGGPAWATGRVVSQDLRINARQWQLDPRREIPQGAGVVDPQGRSEAAVGVAHDTVVAAMAITPADPATNPQRTATVMGLRTTPFLSLSLVSYPGIPNGVGIAPGVPDAQDPNVLHRSAVSVRLLRNDDLLVLPWQYEVDNEEGTITFHWETAWQIRAEQLSAPGTVVSAGHIYGEPLLVTWLDDGGSPSNPADDQWHDDALYVVPPLTRFIYIPGFIRLKYYPVIIDSVSITLSDGTPVLGFAAGEPIVSYDLDGGGADNVLPRGWIDLRAATVDANHNGPDPSDPPIPPGAVLLISYRGFANEWGPVDVGNVSLPAVPSAAPALPPEQQQAPIGFGPSASAVSVAGSAIHVGTEGYDADGDGAFDVPPGARDASETLLSLLWEPASNIVRAWLSKPADLGNFRTGAGQIAAATGLPALATNGLYIGSRIMDDTVQGLDVGFVSHLATRRTIIVDASRVLICTGQDPNEELTGTKSWERGAALADRPVALSFNHPAKVTALGGGNLLVVDTGNNRVVEVDSSGTVVWPLDNSGYNYYSSPANTNLRLSSPSDAQRFENYEDVDNDGANEWVVHTVIADSGNNRVVHVRTWWQWNAGAGRWEQRHDVQTVTPEYIRDPTNPRRLVKAHYTHVALIFHPLPDPATGQLRLIGYLCAAPNAKQIIVRGYVGGTLVTNPPASASLPGGGGTWALWAWLYDPDVSDATDVRSDPLLFANLRHMSLTRLGNLVYLDIACGQYQGRASAWTGVPPYTDEPGVFEFRVSYDPAALGLIPAQPSGNPDPDAPIWAFTRSHYTAVSFFSIPLPDGTTHYKRFMPTSIQVLPNGRRLIANNSGLIERLTKQAVGRTGIVCSSEVFEVETDDQGDLDPINDAHQVDPRLIIPDPYGPDWADPLIAPAYAERVAG